MQSSLFNFFKKTPKQENKNSPSNVLNDHLLSGDIFEEPFEIASTPMKNEVKESFSPSLKSKRRRLILDSSDEDEANEKSVLNSALESPDRDANSNMRGGILRKFAREITNSPSSPRRTLSSDSFSKREEDTMTSVDSSSIRVDDESFSADCSTVFEATEDSWPHLTLPFLQPNLIKDAYGRRPSHPEYDPHTVYVPADYIKKQSPGMRQWWILKSQNFDTILFFKVGKFYELYHQDAIIAVEELRLSLMRGSFAHSGFPETAFQKMADRLLQKGYKVARVEQTETPDDLAKRVSGKPGSDKVVRREICQIITPGTWFANLRGEICEGSKFDGSSASSTPVPSDLEPEVSFNRHLLVILEARNLGNADVENSVGVAILKTATGEIMIGQFDDDVHFSRMCTAIAHYPPSQILFERGNLSTKLRRILKARLPDVPFECLTAGKQFLSASETLNTIESANYFSLVKNSDNAVKEVGNEFTNDSSDWPEDLLKMLDPTDTLGRTPLPTYELAIRCLGAVVFYLKYCLADAEILSLCQITEYQPMDIINASNRASLQPFYERQVNMILDSTTLENLEILSSDSRGSIEGTLLERLDTCCTPFGRRLMRSWLVNPPCNPSTIAKRQDAIEDLMQLSPHLHTVRDGLRRLPDLERLLTKVHIMGWNATTPDHPDSRAVLFEENTYSKRKISDFLATLAGFKSAQKLITHFSQFEITSEYLRSLTTFRSNGGSFPCCKERLSMFEKAFDHEQARRDGRVVVEPGFDHEYDTACRDLKEAERRLDDYLSEQSEIICTRLTYCGTGKNRFQIEVPDSHAKRVPSTWEATSQKRGYKRYRTPTVLKLFSELVSAEDCKVETTQGIMRRIFASFSSSYKDWSAAVRCLSELDCLISLANYGSTAAAITCRPEFFPLDSVFQKPFLEIINGSHPCLLNIFSGKDVTPNDIHLGAIPDQEKIATGFKPGITSLLITGANMGGKSTLMRQTALLAILAHLGCHIPAASCRLTPIDRIFTRIGASDRLISGQSTFYVELAETAIILRHASPQSLVLIDELGRGTSTRDGSSLAGSVLRHISKPRNSLPGPLTLFSTHYHGLADALQNRLTITDQAIDVGHMQCLVGDQNSGTKESEKITFLYKLVPTACPKSYGFNVAHLAHVPEEIINGGVAMANEFEKATLVFSCLRDILAKRVNKEEAMAWKVRLQGLGNSELYQ